MLANQNFLGGGIRIAPARHVTLDQLPASDQLVSDQAVQLTVGRHNAVATQDRAAVANQLIIHNLVGVTGSFDLGAPVDDGHTSLIGADRAALVAVLITGGGLVFHAHSSVQVQGIEGVVNHGLDKQAAAKGHRITLIDCDVTVQHVNINVDDGPIASLVLFFRRDGRASGVVHAIPGPDTHRQTCQRHFAGQNAVIGLG